MIKALIAWGIGFSSGIKYIVTRGLGIGVSATYGLTATITDIRELATITDAREIGTLTAATRELGAIT
jgi:hypothetical protein